MSKYEKHKHFSNKDGTVYYLWEKLINNANPFGEIVLWADVVSKEEYDSHKEEHGECPYVRQECNYTWEIHPNSDKIMKEKLNRQAEAFKRVVKTINQESNETPKETTDEVLQWLNWNAEGYKNVGKQLEADLCSKLAEEWSHKPDHSDLGEEYKDATFYLNNETTNETPDPASYIPIDYIKKKIYEYESNIICNVNLADRQFFRERRLTLLSLLSDWDWDSKHHFYPSPSVPRTKY